MVKVILNDVGDLRNTTTAETNINNNSNIIETAFDNTLSRDGTSPNQMEAGIDMDSNRIVNLPAPVSAGEPLRLQDLSDFNGGGTISTIPAGGAATDVLIKESGTDFDVGWSSNLGGKTFTGVTTPAVAGGTAADGILVVRSTANGSPSGDELYLFGSTTNIGSSVSSPSTINLAGFFGGGTEVNLGSATNGLTDLNVYDSGGSEQTWVPGGGSTTVTFPTATDTLVGKNTTDTLTNKTISGANNTITNVPVATGISGLGAGVATFLGTPSSANLAAAVTGETGTGALVFGTSPSLTTPALGTPSAGTLTNCTGLPISTGVQGLGAGVATFLGTPSSANLRSALTDETGTGVAYFVGGALGSPSSVGTMPAFTLGGAVTGGSQNITSLGTVQSNLFTTGTSELSQLRTKVTGVNFNSANTDNQISLPLPTGYSRYVLNQILISNASASLTTSTFGIFTGTGGTGTAVVTSGTACTVNTAAANTQNNCQFPAVSNPAFPATMNFATLQFRVQTPQGSAATADVTITYTPVS